LKNIKIGGTLEKMYTPEFLKAERLGAFMGGRASTDQMGFKKLLNGRMDLFFADTHHRLLPVTGNV